MALRDPHLLDRTLSPAQRHVLREFADGLRAAYGPRLESVLLFGSRARGDAEEDSDVDVLVLLDVPVESEPAEADKVWQVARAAKRTEPTAYVPLSLVIFAAAAFANLTRLGHRFAVEAEREGIAL